MREALRGYGLLMRWEFLRLRSQLLLIVVIQVVIGLGVVYGMSLLLPRITPRAALYLSTGAPTLSLMILGISVVAQETSRSKDTGRDEYQRALPLPTLAMLAATITFWLLVNLPGTALTLVAANLRIDIALDVSVLVVPVFVLVALTAATVGYALAQSLTPQAMQQVSSFITVGILLFSPINYPLERLPQLLQAAHRVLPITYMADLIRWSLTGASTHDPAIAFGLTSLWCVVGLIVSYRVVTRRR